MNDIPTLSEMVAEIPISTIEEILKKELSGSGYIGRMLDAGLQRNPNLSGEKMQEFLEDNGACLEELWIYKWALYEKIAENLPKIYGDISVLENEENIRLNAYPIENGEWYFLFVRNGVQDTTEEIAFHAHEIVHL